MSFCSDSSSARHRSPRRGVVLIFVVAVLVLLAVIATTYLAMTRADRVSPEIRGGLISPPLDPPPLDEIRLDVFGYALADVNNDAAWHYRPADDSTGSNYGNFDYLDEAGHYAGELAAADYRLRQYHDPWLASREPEQLGAGPTDFGWRKISRWLERWSADSDFVFNTRVGDPPNTNNIGFFESPLGGGGTPTKWSSLNELIPTYVRIDLPDAFDTPAVYAGKAVIYPAFQLPAAATTTPPGTTVVIAADADGDGVADSGLFPLDTWMTGTTNIRPDGVITAGTYTPADPLNHATRWYAAVRIVDNNAAVNVNTAWRRNYDWAASTPEPSPSAAYDSTADATPNYGFFRSNVGLFELLPSAQITSSSPPFDQFRRQWAELTKFRLNLPNAAPFNTGRTDYTFTTLGEALEMNVARRPLRPGPDTVTGGPTLKEYRAFALSLSANLAFMNGLINPRESRSDLETALVFDAYQFVPNWGAADGATAADKPGTDTEKESRSFTFFAAPSTVNADDGLSRPLLWWHSLYNTDNTTRSAYFGTIGAYSGTPLPRTTRQVLTASNPLTTTARAAVSDPIAPTWITSINTLNAATLAQMEPFKQGTKAKAGVNTSTFAELWRNFFLTMKNPNVATPEAAVPLDINPNGRLTAAAGVGKVPDGENALYLRSALAAVNTLDARDGDDDITTLRVEMPSGQHVMIAGAERQLFISRVEIVPNSTTGNNELQVDLYNPYGLPCEGKAYKLAFMDAAGGAYTGPIAVNPAAVPRQNKVTETIVIDAADPLMGAQRHLVLLRTRNADGSPTNDANPKNPIAEGTLGTLTDSELVCVDMVEFTTGLTGAAVGVPYQRDVANWSVAAAGKDFTSATEPPGVLRPNPVAVPNLPAGFTPANAATGNKFPFGGFPRDGDMMLIPYVGHYAFYSGVGTSSLLDVVPITVDVQRVPITPAEQGEGAIAGRFTPVPKPDPATVDADRRSYDWRARIFDNFATLTNPMSDSFPNIAEESWLRKEPPSTRKPVQVITNVDTSTVDERQPVHGLININSAGKDVLNALPFFVNATNGRIDAAADDKVNSDVVDKIIAYRRATGAFRSIVDVADAITTGAPVAGYPVGGWTDKQGHFFASLANVPTPLPAEYATKLHGFVRVSNLISTRSDSFTIYVLLQQWQDFGYPVGGSGGRYPLLIPGTEKRFSIIVDRSQLIEGETGEDKIRKQSVATD